MGSPDAAGHSASAARRIVAHLPLARRKQALTARRAVLRARRRAAERAGRRNLSHPALHGIDLKLAALLGDGGTFFEAGANDGFEQSNTYYLERFHGWRGVLVEPIPELCAEARRARPGARVVQAALVASPETMSVRMHYGGLMSLVAGARGSEAADRSWAGQVGLLGVDEPYEVDVPARTLSNVLAAEHPEALDLMSLDLEGFEHQALLGLDLDRHAPRHLLLETRGDDAGLAAIRDLLAPRYEEWRDLSPFDVLYRRRDQPARSR